MTEKNPFAQPEKLQCWHLHSANISPNLIDELQAHDAVIAISQPALHEPDKLYCYCDSTVASDAINTHICAIAQLCNAAIEIIDITEVQHQDWVAQTQADFPEMQVGRFHVIGSHHRKRQGNYVLHLDAGAAFGTGEHATTSACLRAIDMLMKKQHFSNALDMGCGTAILGMAVAKAQNTHVLAVDNDAVAVSVAQENIHKNALNGTMDALCSEGFKDRTIWQQVPFDLVIANILAKPVRAMAKEIAAVTAADGYIILSGFYVRDVPFVANHYRHFGMKLVKIIKNNGWAALILVRK